MRKSILVLLLLVSTTLAAQESPKQPAVGCNPKILPVLWQQNAAEYRALCYQTFNLAALRLEAIPEKDLKKGNLALITDLDETILDNSRSEAQLILEGQSYTPKNWKEWTSRHEAGIVPGAGDFLRAAHARGVSVIYLSNRDTTEIVSTLQNLRQLNLPDADSAHLLFMRTASSKEARRQDVMKKYKVVMLIGDNLNDFSPLFEKRTTAERMAETDRLKEEWGRRFIVLPNSTYGEWENALYNYAKGLSPQQKDSIRVSLLKGYRGR